MPDQPASLRAEQVAQTRAALVAAGRRMFGEKGFRATSVEDLAREARVTTGALYHHFPNKTALFEAVFLQAHTDLMKASTKAAAQGASDGIDELARGFEAFLDGVLQPDMQRILILDGPAVLGLARYTELDEQYAHAVIVHALTAAAHEGDRASGLFTAAWYLVFVVPLFLFTPDSRRRMGVVAALRPGLSELGATLRGLRRQANATRYLVANMIYTDGMVTLTVFGAIYAASVFDWGTIELGLFGIVIIMAGVVGSYVGGHLDDRIGPNDRTPLGG